MPPAWQPPAEEALPDGSARFHEAVGLTPERWSRLQSVVQRRVLRYFRRYDPLDAHVTHDMATRQASGGFSIDPSVLVLTPLALLARVFELLPLLCPACGGEIRIVAFRTHPMAIRDILIHLGLPHRPPRVAPAGAPPQPTLGLDQTPASDPAQPEPIPEYVFDPTPPEKFGG